jgi:hypothetical protein
VYLTGGQLCDGLLCERSLVRRAARLPLVPWLLLACVIGTTVSGDPAARMELTTRQSGLRFYDEKRGTGESPVYGESVSVHYAASWVRWNQPLTVESHSARPTPAPPAHLPELGPVEALCGYQCTGPRRRQYAAAPHHRPPTEHHRC